MKTKQTFEEYLRKGNLSENTITMRWERQKETKGTK